MSPWSLLLGCLGLGVVVEPAPLDSDAVVDAPASAIEPGGDEAPGEGAASEPRASAPEPPASSAESGLAPSDADAPRDADAPSDAEPPTDAAPASSSAADGEPRQPPPSDPSPKHDVPADDFELEPGTAPGGYYGHGVILERAPPDGRQQIVVGSILVPLGTLATVSSGVGTWLYAPDHCQERLAAVGTVVEDPDSCRGVFTLNAIRTTTGALMLISGATILAIGLVKRQRYRQWRERHGMRAGRAPFVGSHVRVRLSAGGLGLRF